MLNCKDWPASNFLGPLTTVQCKHTGPLDCQDRSVTSIRVLFHLDQRPPSSFPLALIQVPLRPAIGFLDYDSGEGLSKIKTRGTSSFRVFGRIDVIGQMTSMTLNVLNALNPPPHRQRTYAQKGLETSTQCHRRPALTVCGLNGGPLQFLRSDEGGSTNPEGSPWLRQ